MSENRDEMFDKLDEVIVEAMTRLASWVAGILCQAIREGYRQVNEEIEEYLFEKPEGVRDEGREGHA